MPRQPSSPASARPTGPAPTISTGVFNAMERSRLSASGPYRKVAG
jgi:hypothetical protein